MIHIYMKIEFTFKFQKPEFIINIVMEDWTYFLSSHKFIVLCHANFFDKSSLRLMCLKRLFLFYLKNALFKSTSGHSSVCRTVSQFAHLRFSNFFIRFVRKCVRYSFSPVKQNAFA